MPVGVGVGLIMFYRAGVGVLMSQTWKLTYESGSHTLTRINPTLEHQHPSPVLQKSKKKIDTF